jgi:hypothetical protein
MQMHHRFDRTAFRLPEGIMKCIRVPIYLAVILSFLLFPWQAWSAEHQEVMRAILANGLRTVIVKNTLAPVVTTQMNYLAGSNDAPEGFPGTAHALEHLMFRGSPELSAEQLASVAALMGGQFNADTQQTVTQYFFTVPVDDLETALRAPQGVIGTRLPKRYEAPLLNGSAPRVLPR